MYLLDFLLIVITKWLLPINAYEVNEEIIEELKEEASVEYAKDLSWSGTFIIVFVSGLVAVFFNRIIHKLNFGENYNVVFLYVVPIMFIISFIISRHVKKKKILRLLNGRYNKKRIRFRLSSEKNVWKDLLFPVLAFTVLVLVGILFVGYNILEESYDSRDYLAYFLSFLIWFIGTTYTGMRPELLLGATIIIEDK